MLHRQKHLFRRLALALLAVLAVLLPLDIFPSGAWADEELTGYAWEKVSTADAKGDLFYVGAGKLLATISSSYNAVLVDTETSAGSDFGYKVLQAYKVSEDKFFFAEKQSSSIYNIRSCINGVISDPMSCAISKPLIFAGRGDDVYVASTTALAKYNAATVSWDQIAIDPGLPGASFYCGQCTSGYLYLGGKTTSSPNVAVLYRYDRTDGTWENISPDAVNPGSYTLSGTSLQVMDDDSAIFIVFNSHFNTLYSYKNGSWSYEMDIGIGGNRSLGRNWVNNNPLLGSGVLLSSDGYLYFYDGSHWITFSGPADLDLTYDYYSNVCAAPDGTIYAGYNHSSSDIPGIFKLVSAGAADQTPPVITTSAADETVGSSSYTFTVTAIDEVDGAVTPTVKLGGESGTLLAGTPSGGGSYSYTATLAAGENIIYIEAADEAGNKATATYTVTCASLPVFDDGYPCVSNITTEGFDLNLKLTGPGAAYYNVVTDGTSVAGAVYAQWTSLTLPDTDTVSASVYGLNPATAYDVYVIARNNAGLWQEEPVKLDVTTLSAGDTDPPVFDDGYPGVSNITTEGFDLDVKLNEAGAVYYQAVSDGTSVAGAVYAQWTSLAVPGTDTATASVSGLSPATAYDLYVIARDSAGNWQSAPVKLDVTTLSAGQTGFIVERIGSGGFSPGQNASLTVSVTNNTGAEQPATLILCLYDNDSLRLLGYDSVSRTFAAGEQAELTAEGFTIPAAGDYLVKAFVWDSLEGMKPLLETPLGLDVN